MHIWISPQKAPTLQTLSFSFPSWHSIKYTMTLHSIPYPRIELIFFPTLKQAIHHSWHHPSHTKHHKNKKITTPYQVDNKLTNDPHSHHYACTCNTARVLSPVLEDKLLLILSPRTQSKWRKRPLTRPSHSR